MAGKAKITGDKLSKIINYLVESLNIQDSPAMSRVTGVRASVASVVSASLPGR